MSEAPESPFDDTQLAALVALGVERTYARHTVLLQEGDRGHQLYLVRSGRLKVFLADRDGREVIVVRLGPGRLFGELALDDEPRSASVMTVEPARVVTIARERFRTFLAADPDAAWSFITMLMRRSGRLTRAVADFALLDVYDRVARVLLSLAQPTGGRQVLPGPITKVEIARRVGAAREMVSRVLGDMVKRGCIAMEDRCIVILRDPGDRG